MYTPRASAFRREEQIGCRAVLGSNVTQIITNSYNDITFVDNALEISLHIIPVNVNVTQNYTI